DGDDARGPGIADDRHHQQPGLRNHGRLQLQADGLVRRIARADDGRRVPGRISWCASRDHAVPADLRRTGGGTTRIRSMSDGTPGWGALRHSMALTIVALFVATPVSAQIKGHVSVMFDTLPDLGDEDGAQSVSELRTRIFAERHDEFGRHLRINISGYVDGLIADRGTGNPD